MKYIDIHCHLDFQDYEKDFQDVLGRMKEKEVGAITIGTDLESSQRAVKIAEENEDVWACIGIHPAEHPDKKRSEFIESKFEKLVLSPKVVAIGECGLDFFRIKLEDEAEKKRQKYIFEQQIKFALKHDKPLMLHCRNAYDEVLEILENYKKEAMDKLRGDCHFFAGSVEQAKKFVELEFSCSFTGVITFTHDYENQIKSLPVEYIMSETDAPFVAPVPYRGKRNEPVFVVEVVRKMAEIKGLSMYDMAEITINNAKRIFSIR